MLQKIELTESDVLLLFEKELREKEKLPTTLVLKKLFCLSENVKSGESNPDDLVLLKELKLHFTDRITPHKPTISPRLRDKNFMDDIHLYKVFGGVRHYPDTSSIADALFTEDENKTFLKATTD